MSTAPRPGHDGPAPASATPHRHTVGGMKAITLPRVRRPRRARPRRRRHPQARAPARCSCAWPPPGSTAPTCCSARATTRRRPVSRTCRGSRSAGSSRRSARVSTAGPSATRCARCSPAVGTPSRCGCRPGSCCPCRRGCPSSMRRRCPRSCAPCGPTSSSSPTSSPARRCSCTAGRRASGRWRSSWRAQVGAHVAVTAGSAAKLEACRELGAEVLVNYREEDFVERLREATDGHGADVILDIVGAKYLSRNVSALATERPARHHRHAGRHAGRARHRGAAGQARRRHRHLAAGAAGRREGDDRGGGARARVAAGRGGPGASVVHSRHPLADAAAAHRELEAGEHVGKILLTTGDCDARRTACGRHRA